MRLLIAGGGTGGHLYPGIAVAEEVTARPGGEVLFVGTARGLETRLVPAAGFPLELLEVSGLKRVGGAALLRGLGRLPKAYLGARAILRRFRPDLVLGVGGYASGPMVLAAALGGYPTAIQEQNSRPGLTNRVLGRFVRRVFIAFDEARGFFADKKIRLVGNPVRRRFLSAVSAAEDGSPPSANGTGGGSDTVLVVGGSQGARAVNDLIAGAAAALAQAGDDRLPRIIHQTGAADEARVRARYAELGLGDRLEGPQQPAATTAAVAAVAADAARAPRIAIRAYIDDMVGALRAAALVVARAGALTLAELAVVGRPAILIPLPTATDDHQSRNAAELVRAGAAVLAPERTTTAAELAALITALLGDPARRAGMSRAITALGRPGAARDIVDELERMVAEAAA